jgi:KDO2-lipid IV(A) lauroyltransferase
MNYYILHTIVFLMSYIPFPIGQFLGRILGFTASMIPIERNRISLDNIQQSFGNSMERHEITRLYRRVLVHFGQMLFEVPHILRVKQENLDKYVSFEGEDNLLKAIEKGKGVFILTGHFVNWELIAAGVAIRFGQLAVVARTSGSRSQNRLIYKLRSRFGTEIIPKQNSMRQILSALRKNKMIAILLDQNVDWYQGVFVNFLGRWACVNKGLALMALRTSSPVIPIFPVKQKDGRYKIVIGEELTLIKTGDKTMDTEENTALFTKIIERQVKEYPDHWFWFHRRWKTIPYCALPAESIITRTDQAE